MKAKWNLFFGASLLAVYMLISPAIPIGPVFAGCGLAALITWRKFTRQSAQGR